MFTPDNGVLTGRSDTTWGIVAVGYQLRPHFGAVRRNLQPAARTRFALPIPALPVLGLARAATYNNYSQVFFGVDGTI